MTDVRFSHSASSSLNSHDVGIKLRSEQSPDKLPLAIHSPGETLALEGSQRPPDRNVPLRNRGRGSHRLGTYAGHLWRWWVRRPCYTPNGWPRLVVLPWERLLGLLFFLGAISPLCGRVGHAVFDCIGVRHPRVWLELVPCSSWSPLLRAGIYGGVPGLIELRAPFSRQRPQAPIFEAMINR